MKMPKPTEDDRARFRTLVPDDTSVEIRPMFGNLGAFVNGNMFMGLFGSDVGLKLADAQRDKLLTIPDTGPFGPAERPMGGYVTIPANWSPDNARPSVREALAHVAALPPKRAKSRTPTSLGG
jgi:TfoX/Sxy family transcriptional regulator of competence genes